MASVPGSLPTIVLVALASVLTAGASGADVIDRVLATVAGHVITLSDVRLVRRLDLVQVADRAGDPEAATLQSLIDRTLVLEEVERYAPPEPDPAAIAARLDAIRRQFPTEAAWTDALHALGIEAGYVRQWVRNDLRVRSYIDQRFAGVAEPTDEELENYRRQHQGELERDGQPADEAAILRAARERVTAERRQALVREWIDSLRARADLSLADPVAP